MPSTAHTRRGGFGLIDVIVSIALTLILFLSLFGILRASLLVSSLARAKAGATTIAQVQMEYMHGLSYDSVGTVGGIPSGAVVQDATTTENGIDYAVHTFVSYVDDPADGTGASDTNGITIDYKRARVTVSYTIAGRTRSVALVGHFAPPGIESTNGGGTLAINVVNATGAPVNNATVHITNGATAPTVDLTTFTNNAGVVYLPGAATSSEYQVAVSKAGYSSAQTYTRDLINQNPTPGYLAVAKDQTTRSTFAIDLLSTLTLATFSPIATSTFADAFADASKLAAMASTTITGGALALLSGETSGSARSLATTSAYLASWGEARATTTIPTGTSVTLHVYDGAGNLIPDAILPGNAAGFGSFPVPLYGIGTTTYPSLALGANFTGTESSTPVITGWSLSYASGPTPLSNVSFTLTGAKTIGSTGGGAPIYKTVFPASTGGDGTQGVILEWDSYKLNVANYGIVDACPSPPYAIAPDTTPSATLFLAPVPSHSLRVVVTDNAGAAVDGASVTVARAGFSQTVPSSSCGSAYFDTLASASDYTVTIAKIGYTTTDFTGISVSGASTVNASFP
ncbi:carboxypeptidase regulatory-like domain-containing protein [Candidatus Kaiserbacteria bacterium]|nr:carboxypeptidase regulatory-like domain-containing protein [Candidatus Kaiserbacteria bacterium]